VPEESVISRIPLLAFLGMRPVPASSPDVYSVSMPLAPSSQNLTGAPHGGAVATLIDHTGGHASGILADRPGPTADLDIRFLARATGPAIRADARILKAGRRLVVVEVKVWDDDGRLVAVGIVSVAPHPRGQVEPPDG
jgi:uncharacterized protein (TIGR00369 family)